MTLLTTATGNSKIAKGMSKGVLSYILHFAPSTLSGHNVCPMASFGCIAGCLNTAGMGGVFPKIQQARIRKTILFMEHRDKFMEQLVKEIRRGIRSASRNGMAPAFRLNGTSDIRWETIPVVMDNVSYPNVMSAFPNVIFYDYTKLPNRRNIPPNYHLTFSRSETNDSLIPEAMANGMNVAVVFSTKKKEYLPDSWNGIPVIDGDETDLRFTDPSNVIVGLRAKGKAKKDTSGFVVQV